MSRYPYLRTILLYALFGGVLGGVLFFIASCLIPGYDCNGTPTLHGLFTLLWGNALVGLPAALFTGIVLAALRRYRSPSSSLIASAIGAVASGLYIFMIVFLIRNRMYDAVILFAAIGAVASLILSLFLPKGSLKP